MSDREAIPDLDFLTIFATDSEQGSNDTLLINITAEGVIEDREYCLKSDSVNDEKRRARVLPVVE